MLYTFSEEDEEETIPFEIFPIASFLSFLTFSPKNKYKYSSPLFSKIFLLLLQKKRIKYKRERERVTRVRREIGRSKREREREARFALLRDRMQSGDEIDIGS